MWPLKNRLGKKFILPCISVSTGSSLGMPELSLITRMLKKGQMSGGGGMFTVQLTRQSYIP